MAATFGAMPLAAMFRQSSEFRQLIVGTPEPGG
jgi:hypothetical protein